MRKVGQGAGPCGQSHHWRGVLIHEDPESECLSPDPQAFTTHPSDRHCLKQTHRGPRAPDPGSHCSKSRHPKAARHRTLPGTDNCLPVFYFGHATGRAGSNPCPRSGSVEPLTTGLPGEVPNYLLALKQGPYGPPCHRVAWLQLSERKLENAVN